MSNLLSDIRGDGSNVSPRPYCTRPVLRAAANVITVEELDGGSTYHMRLDISSLSESSRRQGAYEWRAVLRCRGPGRLDR